MPRNCAFCGQATTLTREHVWPAAMHARLSSEPGQSPRGFYSSRLGIDLPNEPVIKDVCGECNSGPLSALDAYICSMWDRYFCHSLHCGEKVVFEYDYHRLARWLLKLCFNSARGTKAFDLFALEPLVSYIKDDFRQRSSSVRLFVELQFPARIPPEDAKSMGLPERPDLFEPKGNRVGHIVFTSNDGRKKVLRAVHLRSFSFLIAFFMPGHPEDEITDFARTFLRHRPRTRLLVPQLSKVDLICGQQNAWDSFKSARSTIRFEEDATLPMHAGGAS